MRIRSLLLSVLLLSPTGVIHAATAHVSARIDGLSELILSAGTAKWHHISYNPPGVTTINGVAWSPTGLSNGCDCDSGLYTGLLPPMAQSTTGYSVVKNAGRGAVTIEETPSSANGWALRIRIDDEVAGGDDLYDFDVTYPAVPAGLESVPTASTWTLALFGGVLALAGVWVLRR